MYQKLISHGKMDRLRFREVMHTVFDITDDVMLDRIFRAFDSNNDSMVCLASVRTFQATILNIVICFLCKSKISGTNSSVSVPRLFLTK